MRAVRVPAVSDSARGPWTARLKPEEVEVKGCLPHPSLPQMPGLEMALQQDIWSVLSFLSLPKFFSFLFF